MATQYAQSICLNGHQRSVQIRWGVDVQGFCEECGSKLISKCPACDYPIPGYVDPSGDGVLVLGDKPRAAIPKYCGHCGNPFPWTQAAIESAQELIDLSELDTDDKDKFKDSIPEIMTESPKTKVAATKFKIFATKAGSMIADGLKDVLVDIVSETAKKIIWPS